MRNGQATGLQRTSGRAGAGNPGARGAFTLIETISTAALFGLVVAGTIEVFVMCNKFWHATSLSMQTSQTADIALSRIVQGYGTNLGLRAARSIQIITNFHGWPMNLKYWETNGAPPAADNSIHHICACDSYPRDGSWRMIVSNEFDGVTFIEYNAKIRALYFCPVTNFSSQSRQTLTTTAERNRISIGNFISSATATVNVNGAISVLLAVEKRDGMFSASNEAGAFIAARN